MGGFGDVLGTIAIDIVGDYSQLQADLDAAAASAAASAEEISGAFNGASEGFNEFSDAAQSVIDKQAQLDAAVSQAQAVVQELERGYEQGTVSAEALARAQDQLATATERATITEAAGSEALLVEEGAAGALLGRLRELGPELLAGFGMVEFGKAVIEATGQLQQATVALTALTGSAEIAQEQIAQLREMSEDQALSFPALLEANQRMVAFGFDLATIPGALQAAADASVALNTSVDNVANALDRVALSGQLSTRQLATIGVSMHDIAEAMGTTDDQAKVLFADLDASARVQVLTTAIEQIKQFQGLADKAKDTIPSMGQQIKNSWEDAFQTIGNATSFVIGALEVFAVRVGQAVDLLTRLAQAGAIVWASLAKNAVQAIAEWTHLTGVLQPVIDLLDRIASSSVGPGTSGPAGPPLQVQDTSTRVGNLVKTFNEDLKTQDWKEAEQIIATLGKLDAPVAQDALQRLVKAQHDAADAARGLGQETEKYKAISGDVTSDLQLTIAAYQKQQAEVKATAAAIAAYGAKLADAGVNIAAINLPQAYFNDLIAKANANMTDAMQSTPPYVDTLKDFGATLEQDTLRANDWISVTPQIKSELKGIADGSFSAAKSLDEMMGKLSGPTLSAAESELFKIRQDLAAGDWQKAERTINQLAINDLPQAVREYDALIDAAKQHGALLGDVIALQEKQLDLEIEYGDKTGTDVSRQVIALKNLQVEQTLLKDSAEGLGKVYSQLTDTFMNMWDQFAQGISDAIVNSKDLGDAIMNVLKKIEQEILNTLIGYVMQQLRDAIVKDLIGPLTQSLGLTKQLTATAGQGIGGATSAAGGGGLAGAPSAGAAAGGGGLFSVIGAVGSVVGAIAGIVGDVEQAHTNTLLGRIEQWTRGSLVQLIDLQNTFNQYLPALFDIRTYTAGLYQIAAGAAASPSSGGPQFIINGNFNAYGTMTQQDLANLAADLFRQFKLAGG